VVQTGPEFESVVGGGEFSGLISDSSIIDYIIHRGLTQPVMLQTLAPFRAELMAANFGTRPILGVFELIIDLTTEMNQVYRLQVLVALVAGGLLAILSVILTLIVRQGERILNRRAEERKRLEVKLQETERMAALGRMVASVSHEIKTPLGIIRSTGELLGSNLEEDETCNRLTGVIVEECSRLNRIVTEFLDFARPLEPSLRSCQVGEVLERVINALEPELDRQGIGLEKELRDGPEAKADPDLLYRAFLNVLVNAIQAMPNGGRIRVKAEPAPRRSWRVEVADSGVGISAQEQERVFEPFFTLKEKGSGLGLSIVKSIIEAHQGRIEISSEPDQGTRVVMVI
jgi:signal transduction histidine kinase